MTLDLSFIYLRLGARRLSVKRPEPREGASSESVYPRVQKDKAGILQQPGDLPSLYLPLIFNMRFATFIMTVLSATVAHAHEGHDHGC
jgi:hypothetical protein